MNYSTKLWTFGAELEYADVLYGQKLPNGYTWNTKDYTIVNSSGVANDPAGKLWPFGGEINTRPARTPNQLVKEICECNAMLSPPPVINYRSNLHIHVRVPGLQNDLESCKRLLQYITKYYPKLLPIIEPIPYPTAFDYPSHEALAGAIKRYKRRKRSHQYMVPLSRVHEMMDATTIEEFFQAHTVKGRNGKPLWIYAPRACVNLRQMWNETNTIEFRHFPGTLDKEELLSCVVWCKEFLHAALTTNEPAHELLARLNLRFPTFAVYQHDLELIYDKTNLAHNSKAVVKKNILELQQMGVLKC